MRTRYLDPRDVLAWRAALGDDGQRWLACDDPDWPDTPLPDGAEVLGEVLRVANWLSRPTSTDDRAETVLALAPSQDKGKKANWSDRRR